MEGLFASHWAPFAVGDHCRGDVSVQRVHGAGESPAKLRPEGARVGGTRGEMCRDDAGRRACTVQHRHGCLLLVVSRMDRQHLARTADMLNRWLCNLREDLPPGLTSGEHQTRLRNVSVQPDTLLCLNKLVVNYILSSLGRDHHFCSL